MLNNLLGCKITLVTYQELVNIFICISVNLVEPLFDIIEALLVSYIIYNLTFASQLVLLYVSKYQVAMQKTKLARTYNYPMCSSIVAAGDCSKALLASSVPLQMRCTLGDRLAGSEYIVEKRSKSLLSEA